jgi:hypothetical protein
MNGRNRTAQGEGTETRLGILCPIRDCPATLAGIAATPQVFVFKPAGDNHLHALSARCACAVRPLP